MSNNEDRINTLLETDSIQEEKMQKLEESYARNDEEAERLLREKYHYSSTDINEPDPFNPKQPARDGTLSSMAAGLVWTEVSRELKTAAGVHEIGDSAQADADIDKPDLSCVGNETLNERLRSFEEQTRIVHSFENTGGFVVDKTQPTEHPLRHFRRQTPRIHAGLVMDSTLASTLKSNRFIPDYKGRK